jgi:hypothetical protein
MVTFSDFGVSISTSTFFSPGPFLAVYVMVASKQFVRVAISEQYQ